MQKNLVSNDLEFLPNFNSNPYDSYILNQPPIHNIEKENKDTNQTVITNKKFTTKTISANEVPLHIRQRLWQNNTQDTLGSNISKIVNKK